MKTLLLVVDAQKIYTDANSEMYCDDANLTILNINRLIEKFETEKYPTVFIRHIHKKDGSDLGRMFDFSGEPEDDFNFKVGTDEIEYDNNLIIPENAIHIVKTRYSSFIGTQLDSLLKKYNVEKIVICGFMTNFCCESTARDAHDLDYFVDFIIDATGTPGTENYNQDKMRNIITELLSEGFAVVMKLDDYLNK